MHQQLFLTPLSVFSLGRFWAGAGGVLELIFGLLPAVFGPRAPNRENLDF